MSTILVTGGAGYIGSHTCVELLNAGYDVVVVVQFLPGILETCGGDYRKEADLLRGGSFG